MFSLKVQYPHGSWPENPGEIARHRRMPCCCYPRNLVLKYSYRKYECSCYSFTLTVVSRFLGQIHHGTHRLIMRLIALASYSGIGWFLVSVLRLPWVHSWANNTVEAIYYVYIMLAESLAENGGTPENRNPTISSTNARIGWIPRFTLLLRAR